MDCERVGCGRRRQRGKRLCGQHQADRDEGRRSVWNGQGALLPDDEALARDRWERLMEGQKISEMEEQEE